MKRRSDYRVEVIGHPRDLHAGEGIITAVTDVVDCLTGDPLRLFVLSKGAEIIARCESAKRLSDWAFSAGASRIVHDFNLALSEGEP